MNRMATESSSGKAAAAEIKAKADKLRGQIEAKQKQLEKQKGEMGAKLQALPREQREAKAKEFQKQLQKKVEDFQKFMQKAQNDLQNKEGELLSKLYQSTQTSAAEYGESKGFSVIVSRKELLYLDRNSDVKDITDDIIKLVNAPHKKK